MVWQQYRRVDVGDVSIEELDMKISITFSKDSGLMFDITVWNLANGTWESISKGDPCRVTLGWKGGPTKNVLFGTITKLSKSVDGMDLAFRFKGKDETSSTLRYAFTRSYQDKTYTEIAQSIANEIGLTVGSVDPDSAAPTKVWTMSRDKTARYWLNQLVSQVKKKTGDPWEWFVDSGKFYFVRKDALKEEAVKLSFDNTLVSITESDGEKDAKQPGIEFEAMCEPRIRKGAAVVVDTEAFQGAYKVMEYKFISNTENGDHFVSGKLAPLGASYVTEPAGVEKLLKERGRP